MQGGIPFCFVVYTGVVAVEVGEVQGRPDSCLRLRILELQSENTGLLDFDSDLGNHICKFPLYTCKHRDNLINDIQIYKRTFE